MLKSSYTGCFGLSPAILEMHFAARNRDKFTKNPYFGVHGHLRSSMLTFLRSSSTVLAACLRLSAAIFTLKRANNGRITAFKGVPLFIPLIHGDPFYQWYEILSRNTRDTKLSCGENQKSLSHMVLERNRDVTDTKTGTKRQNYHS